MLGIIVWCSLRVEPDGDSHTVTVKESAEVSLEH